MATHLLKMGLDPAWKGGMENLIFIQILIWFLIMNLGVVALQLTLLVEFGLEGLLVLLMVALYLLVVFLWSHFLIITLRFRTLV